LFLCKDVAPLNGTTGVHGQCDHTIVAVLALMSFLSIKEDKQAYSTSLLCKIVLVCGFISLQTAMAQDVEFTFEKMPGFTYGMECGNGGIQIGCASGFSSDDTRFLQAFSVIVDGESYIHQIVGDLSTGFVQEIFVNASKVSGTCSSPSCATTSGSSEFMHINPTAAVMKMIINESDGPDSFSSEFLKDRFNYRAKIHQDITSLSMSSQFEIDARHLDLFTFPDVDVAMINTINIDDSSIPTSSFTPDSNFDMNVDSKDSVSVKDILNYRYDELLDTYEFQDPFAD